MGVCQSLLTSDSEVREQYKVSRAIDKDLEKKSDYLEQKILLLGPGESGKSTVLKQMKLMHQSAYSSHELMEKKYLVFLNIMQGMQQMLNFVEENSLQLSEALQECADYVTKYIKKHGLDCLELETDLVAMLKKLWASEAVQTAFQHRSRYHLTDSVEYFYDEIDRISAPSYVPSSADILHTRVPTTGVVRVEFVLKNIKFQVVDVGGQRSERKKWIHCFDDVNAILFIAAVSEFDQKVVEDNATNRIDEALKLFYDIANSKYFRPASLILFLNKIDLFRKKITNVFISDHFTDFKQENTYENGMLFFRKKFERLILDNAKRAYVHETCAVSDTVQIVLNSVIDTIVQENLKDTGMI
ncbi:unnamed protein product [Caenorhabditis bovis]|uniref:Uncharacterized protein n=1 Tax=Caenorhabditis bovis TaxID=2654633 RepID=A0A8S1EE57_9PELO|nr:unnamed protein product [Caenorhabditis bovis]